MHIIQYIVSVVVYLILAHTSQSNHRNNNVLPHLNAEVQEGVARPVGDVGVDLSDPRRVLEAALEPPRPAGGRGPHERRISLGVLGVDGTVLPRQRNLPQLVGVVPLGQQVEEAGLAGVCIVSSTMLILDILHLSISRTSFINCLGNSQIVTA